MRRRDGQAAGAETCRLLQTPQARGFRHFIRAPTPSERIALDGAPYDPADAARRAKMHGRLRRLRYRQEREPAPSADHGDNPRIPAGYTYFFQLVAHDFVHSTAFLSLAEGRLTAVENTRSAALRLETTYADGPAARPDLYEASGARSRFPPLLRVGPLRANGRLGGASAEPVSTGIAFDLARGRCPLSSGARANGLPEAVVGDPRNDDHPLLSQMTVLLHHLHNEIARDILARDLTKDSAFDDDHVAYLAARAATTLIYRNVIRHDLLARLLHPDVRAAYEGGRAPIDPPMAAGARWRAPLELSHGVLRVAHSMIRASYFFNEMGHPEEFSLGNMVQQSSNDDPTQMPLQHKWAVDWRLFFGEPGAAKFNLSRRLGARAESQLFDPSVVEPDAQGRIDGLVLRDLQSAVDAQPWSLGALVAELRASHGDLLDASPLLRRVPGNPAARAWQAPLAEWLGAVPPLLAAHAFEAGDIDAIAADPPLPLFFGWEAQTDPATGGGMRLGMLGSILLADAIYCVLGSDPLTSGSPERALPALLESLSSDLFEAGPGALSFIPDIRTFSQILEFLRSRNIPQPFPLP
jgi:hypothetical protein